MFFHRERCIPTRAEYKKVPILAAPISTGQPRWHSPMEQPAGFLTALVENNTQHGPEGNRSVVAAIQSPICPTTGRLGSRNTWSNFPGAGQPLTGWNILKRL